MPHFAAIHNGIAAPRIEAPNIPILVIGRELKLLLWTNKADNPPAITDPAKDTMMLVLDFLPSKWFMVYVYLH